MINEQLTDYIKKALDAGYGEGAIKNRLVTSGYISKDVDDSINYVKSSFPKIAPPPNPSSAAPQQSLQDAKTAQYTAANVKYAGFWIRFSAAIWDTLILGIPLGILQVLLLQYTGIIAFEYLIALSWVIITVCMEGIRGGTPGKLLLGLKIQNEKGKLIGIPYAILRYIGKMLSTIILCIGFFMIGWDKKKQGLHDKIAKTYVVKTKERKGFYIMGIVLGILGIIIIPIILIGVLVYFGVLPFYVPWAVLQINNGLIPGNESIETGLNPNMATNTQLMENICLLQEGLDCKVLRATTNSIELNVINNLGFDVLSPKLNASGCGIYENSVFSQGSNSFFSIGCNPPLQGQYYDGSLELGYSNANNDTFTAIGQITAKIEH